MSLLIQPQYQDQFLELMNQFNPSCVYPMAAVAETLCACGLEAVADADGGCLQVGETKINLRDVEWGEKGVSPLQVLCAVIDAHGFDITTRMSGTGFRYRDLLEKLAAMWGIKKNYM